MTELEEFKTQAEVEEKNIALVNHIFSELRKGNIENVSKFLDSDLAFYTPSRSSSPLSADETVDFLKTLYTAFPDFNYSIVDIIAKGDKVIIIERNQGTHQGEFRGVPATGNKIDVSDIAIFRIKDGMIVEIWEEVDMLGWMEQLGMELKPKK